MCRPAAHTEYRKEVRENYQKIVIQRKFFMLIDYGVHMNLKKIMGIKKKKVLDRIKKV